MKADTSCGVRAGRTVALAGILLTALAASGCISTGWETRAARTDRTMTVLVARSHPQATVFIDGEDRGTTPLEFPLHYSALRKEQTRDVTLWMSNPKLATALFILTGGAYLPSSLFPIAKQSQTERAGFRNNAFHVRIEAPGHEPFDSMILLQGQPEETIDVDLQPAYAATRRSEAPETEDAE